MHIFLVAALVALISRGLARSNLSTLDIPAIAPPLAASATYPVVIEAGHNTTELLRRGKLSHKACSRRPDNAQPRCCWCYERNQPEAKRVDVHRDVFGDAINAACAVYSKTSWGTRVGVPYKVFTYYYTPEGWNRPPLGNEGGIIRTRVAVTNHAKPACWGPFNLDFETCKKAMFRPVDGCHITRSIESGGGTGYGGEAVNDCLHWWVDPRPASRVDNVPPTPWWP